MDVSLSTNNINVGTSPSKIPDVGAVKNYVTSYTSSAALLDSALHGKLDEVSAFPGFVEIEDGGAPSSWIFVNGAPGVTYSMVEVSEGMYVLYGDGEIVDDNDGAGYPAVDGIIEFTAAGVRAEYTSTGEYEITLVPQAVTKIDANTYSDFRRLSVFVGNGLLPRRCTLVVNLSSSSVPVDMSWPGNFRPKNSVA